MIFFFLRLVHLELLKTGRSLFIRTNKGALSSGRASSKLQFIFTGRKIQLGDNYHFGSECRFQPKFIFLFFSRTESVHLTSTVWGRKGNGPSQQIRSINYVVRAKTRRPLRSLTNVLFGAIFIFFESTINV
jgi:hypothetical protein